MEKASRVFYSDEIRAAEALEKAKLKVVTPSEANWSLDCDQKDAWGWPGVIVALPPRYGRIPVSERVAERSQQNARFVATPSATLIQSDHGPHYKGNVFAIVRHSEHGLIAVTPEEFAALKLSEIPAASIGRGA